jgi:diguanylate cyclase (GGDEF)-like protein/PAS domain S-box-containing protein
MDENKQHKINLENLVNELRLTNKQLENEVVERQRAETQLHKLSTSLEQTGDLVLITDKHGVPEYVNPAFLKLTGFSEQEIVGKSPRLMKSGSHSTKFYQNLWRTILAGEIFHAVFINRKKNGNIYYEEKTISPVRDEHGNISNFVSVGRDITARRQSERALRESQERYRNLFQLSPLGVAYANLESYIIELNPKFLDILGSTSVKETKSINLLTYPLLIDIGFSADLRRCIDTHQTIANTVLYTSKWGKTAYINYYFAPVNDADKKIVGILINLEDITERKNATEAYQALVDHSLQGLAIVQENKVMFANPTLVKIFGYSAVELLSMSYEEMLEIIHWEDRMMVRQRTTEEMVEQSMTSQLEVRIIRKDNEIRWIEQFATVIEYRGKQAFQIAYIDITERKQAEEKLRERERFIQSIASASPNILYLFSIPKNRNIYANRNVGEMLGYTDEEIGDYHIHPEDLIKIPIHLARLEESEPGDVLELEYRLQHKNGEWRWLLRRELVFNRTPDGKLNEILGATQDITDRKEAEITLKKANEMLQRLATMDGLTQIANRRRFDEYLSLVWEQLGQEDKPLSLIFMDIDYFKRYNDYYGHLQGDACLQQIAQSISRTVKRSKDLVARYGGEEFAVILPNTSAAGAVKVAEYIQQEIHQCRIPHAESKTGEFLTLSIGVGTVKPNSTSLPEMLIDVADKALYQAKEHGRNQISLITLEHSG